MLGILMLNTYFPRIVGDIGNEQTFSFPICKYYIEGASSKSVVLDSDDTLLERFIAGAKELEKKQCTAITTSCGFLAMFQKELAAAVNVPVFTSALLQGNFVQSMLPLNKVIGIMTADSSKLSEKHYLGAGITDIEKVVYGMEGTHFYDVFVGNQNELEYEKVKKEMVDVARRMVREHPKIAAVILECTNMPPYAQAVREAIQLPVYDITTLANYVMLSNGGDNHGR